MIPTKVFKIRNYEVYRKDREQGRGGGTAVLVKRGIVHHELPEVQTANIEETGVSVKTKAGEINIYSVYRSPNNGLEEADVKNFFRTKKPTIIAGDLNAKHPDWNSRKTNPQGTKLRAIADKYNLLVLGPEDPTHIHETTGTMDVLDIALMKNVSANYDIETKMDLSSYHSPVILTLEIRTDRLPTDRKTINWAKFNEIIQIKRVNIESKEQVDEAIEDLEKRMIEAEVQSTKIKKIPKKRPLPLDVRILLEEKKKAKKQYRRTLNPSDKTILNKLTNDVKNRVGQVFNEDWDKKLEELDTEDQSLWKMTTALTGRKMKAKIPALKKGNQVAVTNEEKAEMFAESLEHQFKPNQKISDDQFNQSVELHGNITDEDHNEMEEDSTEVTEEEVEEIIKTSKNRKAPGIDGILNQAIKNLPGEARDEIAVAQVPITPTTDAEVASYSVAVKKGAVPKVIIHDIPRNPIDLLALYADDTGIAVEHRRANIIHQRLQEVADEITKWCIK
ncbi:uncharacterized protein LOC123675461 [Harmonia axyridis]|uniref:uncharacterized protein LOC123675461 n=1 Tax=Harmonia axyridis TaxID=115357 RepID=UPI001E275D80|nr:uncharacterized protein LOC123675461 [Harmonia axyridis]